MATFDGKHLKGLIGKLVIRRGKKTQILQRAPVRVKQTKATKKASAIFGQGSTLARKIRHTLIRLYNDNYDGEMINRLNTPVRAVLRECHDSETEQYNFAGDSFNRLAGFEFNSKSLLINSLWIQPKLHFAANNLTISIPEINIPAQLKFPAGANLCNFNIVVSQVVLQQKRYHQPLFQQIEINKDQNVIPAQELTFEVASGVLCVAGLGLKYYGLKDHIKTPLNSKTFNPAGIIGAIHTEGTFILPTPTPGVASLWRPF